MVAVDTSMEEGVDMKDDRTYRGRAKEIKVVKKLQHSKRVKYTIDFHCKTCDCKVP